MSYAFSTVQQVINKVSQDIRLQLASTVGSTGQPILIDYTDRINKEMLRFSRWQFIKSEPQYFMTVKGQTDYWLGTTAENPAGTVDTLLNLADVDYIEKDSVRDLSNAKSLYSLGAQPIGNQFNFRSGQSRQGRPGQFWQDHNDPFVLHVYPAADNNNPYQPVPSSPYCTAVAGGSLAAQNLFVRLTFVDSLGLESVGSTTSVERNVPANFLLVVASPSLDFTTTSTGVEYSSYNVYVGNQGEGSETLQNGSPISLGTNWTEPTSGIITTGQSVPDQATITTMGGYVIQFRYFKDRLDITTYTQSVQIPNDYVDVIVNGISALAWKFLQRADDASACQQLYKAGLTQMVWDKNLFPDQSFISPDPATYVNQQNMGILPSNN